MGHIYPCHLWLKYAATGGTDGGNINFQCFNGDTQLTIGSTFIPNSIGTTYTQFAVSFTVPANTTQIRISFENSSNVIMYVDDAQLVNSTTGARAAVVKTTIFTEVDNNIKVMVTPNPITDYAVIKITSPVKDNLAITISDMSGKIIFKRQMRTKEQSITLRRLPSNAMYILKVMNSKNEVVIKKILQQ